MRVLIITNLFPNAQHPRAASFNRQQFAALGRICEVEVLATLPWYPGQNILRRFANHKVARDVPKHEVIDGLSVHHPKTLHLPKVGLSIATPLFTASLWRMARKYRGKVDVVLGSWAHPDGCAAVALAKMLHVPVVVKVHGTDINHVAQLPGPKRMMQWILPKADAIIAVSTALAEGVSELGVDPRRIHLVFNGVNPASFHPKDRNTARKKLGLPIAGTIALCVGNLIQAKGVLDLRDAFRSITEQTPNLHLYFVGEGKARNALEESQPARMHLAGSQPFETISDWMAACDFLVLPSWNEGTPNVILEALACGRRVLATRVGGVPDLLVSAALGQMVSAKSPPALARALADEAKVRYDPSEVAKLGSRGDWAKSAADLKAVLTSVLES